MGKHLPGPGPVDGIGSSSDALASCTDTFGICSQLNDGSVTAFKSECQGAGNAFSMSACSLGAYQCTGGTSESSGSVVAIDIHWPSGVCSRSDFQDKIYLKGTCETLLGGNYSGDADSCCSGATSPVPGGTACQ